MAKSSRAKAEPEVLEAQSPDLVPVENDGTVVTHFIGNVVQFFRDAMSLEAAARDTLGRAQLLKAPKNADDDGAIQTFIKAATADGKAIEQHYEPVTAAFHGIHRRLTAARGRAVRHLEDAKGIAQRLHNTYAEEQKRKAREEEERLRREEEARQRIARDAEVARLEDEALAAEAAMPDLSEREERFSDYVASDVYMPARAAQLAGYANPEEIAVRLMANPKIVTAINAKRDAKRIRTQAQVRREEPISTATVPAVRPKIGKAVGGSHDREYHKGDILNADALVAAVIAGGYGIPSDVLMVNPSKLNEYADSLRERINAWPGVRYRKETKTV